MRIKKYLICQRCFDFFCITAAPWYFEDSDKDFKRKCTFCKQDLSARFMVYAAAQLKYCNYVQNKKKH